MLERADHMNERRILVLTTHTGSVSFIGPNSPSLDGIAEVEEDPRDMVGRGKMGHRTVFISLAGDGTAVLSPVLRSAQKARAYLRASVRRGDLGDKRRIG